jgi:hypothetical protein
VVFGIQVLGDGAGGEKVGGILEADGEGLEPLSALLVPAGGDGGHQA